MKLMVCVALLGAGAASQFANHDDQRFSMSNGYFKVVGRGPEVIGLRVDPNGKGEYGRNWLVSMGFRGVKATGRSRVIAGPARVRITDIIAQRLYTIRVCKPRRADRLQPGHTLGQSFTVRDGQITRLEVRLPTWHTSTSGATLRLRRGGPGGEVVAQRRLSNVRDNSWQELVFDPQGPGTYYVELADPEGTIGWWSRGERRYSGGRAYADGRPLDNAERALRVYGGRTVAEGTVVYSLGGRQLRAELRLSPGRGEAVGGCPLLMRWRWDNTGYDVSKRSVPFKRFFTDNFRYMPVEQLKRWKESDGWYALRFGGCSWIEADGTDNFDLRFSGDDLGLAWHVSDDEATLQLGSRLQPEGGRWRTWLGVEVLARRDALPEEWPRFSLPDRSGGHEATIFFYERAFTYGAVWGPAAWHEWNALGRLWHAGPHIDAIRRNLEHYPISEEGYVHTWGARPGWPFPDNTKYDTRHFDTNARFILACWRYAAWTGDREFLKRQADRIRRAMEYQLTTLRGREGLIVTASKDVTGRHKGVGNNYWDILPFGHLDAYANVVWYASLEAMAQIEEMIDAGGGVQTTAPRHSPEFYRDLAEKARRAYNAAFWDEEKGRYIGCIDVDGKRHDYGFTFLNLEAMAYGLADRRQAERIYRWMETEPTSSGEADTYTRWIFAPRATTIHNPRWNEEKGKLEDVAEEPWWHFGWHGTAFGDQCQDGGAILYTSFYDLMARTRFRGPDDALGRWRAIMGRVRMPDRLCGGPPLYRGEIPQQIMPGQVGVDVPFPESSLVPCWLVYGVLGANATSRGLEIEPHLPSDWPWIEIHNLAYRGLSLNVRATRREVVIKCEAPGYEFTWRRELGAEGKVVFRQPPAPVRFPQRPVWLPEPKWKAEWIWLADREAPRAWFRHSLPLTTPARSAWLAITADNRFRLIINGKEIGEGNNWNAVYRYDIARYLRRGTNIIAVEAHNTDGPAGLLAEGEVLTADGRKVAIRTGTHWRVSDRAAAGWLSAGFDDSGWHPATAYGRPPVAPWGPMPDPAPPTRR